MPVLIEWGGLDTVQPRAAAEMFRRQIPGAHLVFYPGVGHNVIEEAPAASERDAAAFLSSAARNWASRLCSMKCRQEPHF